MNNFLRNDRHHGTTYIEELSTLSIDDKGAYTENKTLGIPSDNQWYTEVSIGKDSIDKNNNITPSSDGKRVPKHKHGQYSNVLLTDEEYQKLNDKYGSNYSNELIQYLDDYIEMKGYKAKSHYLCILKWVDDAYQRDNAKSRYQTQQVIVEHKQTYDASNNKQEDLSDLEEFLKNREG